jgi:hypothetical protein
MSLFFPSSGFNRLQTADRAISDDDESDLSDNLSLKDPMDVDIDPSLSEPIAPLEKPSPRHGSFSVQYLLPLEVRYQLA